jgi:flagellin-like protein
MKEVSKSKKGLSPVLATLLLIVIAVAAVIVTYAWIMTFTGATSSESEPVLTVKNVRFYTHESNHRIDIIIGNAGSADATVDAVYFGETVSNLEISMNLIYSDGSQSVAPSSTLTITILDCLWDQGETYYFNIGTQEGVNLPFNREA